MISVRTHDDVMTDRWEELWRRRARPSDCPTDGNSKAMSWWRERTKDVMINHPDRLRFSFLTYKAHGDLWAIMHLIVRFPPYSTVQYITCVKCKIIESFRERTDEWPCWRLLCRNWGAHHSGQKLCWESSCSWLGRANMKWTSSSPETGIERVDCFPRTPFQAKHSVLVSLLVGPSSTTIHLLKRQEAIEWHSKWSLQDDTSLDVWAWGAKKPMLCCDRRLYTYMHLVLFLLCTAVSYFYYSVFTNCRRWVF